MERTITEKIIVIAVTVLLGLIGSIAAQTGPGIKLVRIVHDCKEFSAIRIHPARFILSSGKERPWPPCIHDIESGAMISLPPLEDLPGMPRPQEFVSSGNEIAYEKNRLVLQGKYWSWTQKSVVYYDPAKGKAGLLMVQYKPVKFIEGNPSCKSCGMHAEYIEKYGRYYCSQCRTYVDEKDYIRYSYESYYAEMDLKSRSLLWIEKLESDWGPGELTGIQAIGVDPTGNYFYYCNNNYFYHRERTTGRVCINRFNIASRKVDWQYVIQAPVRKKDAVAGSYDIHVVSDPGCSRFFVWEYDEAWAETPGVGWLKNPGPQGYVLDAGAKSHFSFTVPVTPYGNIFDRNGKFLIIGSNQTGMIHRINLEKKAEDGRFQASGTILKLLLSPGGKYLFSINKKTAEIFSWPDMKKVKTVPWAQIIPGVKELLTAERMYDTADGKYAVIGVLKASENGPWYSSDLNDGFSLLKIEE